MTLACFCSWAGWFESYQVKNSEDRFFRDVATLKVVHCGCLLLLVLHVLVKTLHSDDRIIHNLHSDIQLINHDSIPTDQPKKKAIFSRFAAEHPLREIIFFAEKIKNHLFRRGNSATFRGETSLDFAEKLREIPRPVGKDLRFLHAVSEYSDQTEKLSECPAWYESSLDGS